MKEKTEQDKESATVTFEPPKSAETQSGNLICPDGE